MKQIYKDMKVLKDISTKLMKEVGFEKGINVFRITRYGERYDLNSFTNTSDLRLSMDDELKFLVLLNMTRKIIDTETPEDERLKELDLSLFINSVNEHGYFTSRIGENSILKLLENAQNYILTSETKYKSLSEVSDAILVYQLINNVQLKEFKEYLDSIVVNQSFIYKVIKKYNYPNSEIKTNLEHGNVSTDGRSTCRTNISHKVSSIAATGYQILYKEVKEFVVDLGLKDLLKCNVKLGLNNDYYILDIDKLKEIFKI